MITFQVSGYLTEFSGGSAEIKIDGPAASVGDALEQLWIAHAGLRDRVLTEQGKVRPHINVFVNNQVVQRDGVMNLPIGGGDIEICIMPAVSGGSIDRA
jgi:molybdopterin converting factor small subunit